MARLDSGQIVVPVPDGDFQLGLMSQRGNAMTDPTAYGGSWYAAGLAAPERGRLTIETDVDVCVIGGGLAGLTVAREAARRGWSVALLEARRVAWNASGRNMGVVSPGFSAERGAIIDRVGIEHAKALWTLSVAGADYVRRAIRECRMTGIEYGAGGWLNVSKIDNDAEIAARTRLLIEQFEAEVEYWPRDRVRAALKSPRYFGATHYRRAFTINPLAYALGLAAAAEAAGARIYEMTPALALDPDGVRKRIATPSARLRARHVVIAGNVQVGPLMPKLARTLVPVSAYVMVTAPLGEKLRDAIGIRGGVSDSEFANSHYRVVGGDRLMWSGHATVWDGSPRRRVRAMAADIARAYPQLGAVTAEFAWTGTLGMPVHRMPQLGELSPGVWLASGFGSRGLNTTAMAGELIARAIVEGDDGWRLFEPFDLVWAGGALGRAAAQIYSWRASRNERAANERACQREAAQPPAPPLAPVEMAPPAAEADDPAAGRSPRTRRKPKRRTTKVVGPATAAGDAPVSDKQSAGGVS
jgi:glycine/D-amino acid oxidase-like deaminating enzyme